MVPTFPVQLLPTAADSTARLLVDLLYDPLYRLDGRGTPARPGRELPTVSRTTV